MTQPIGQAGLLHFLQDSREVIVASYCAPCTAKWFERVPIMNWPNAAANDGRSIPNDGDTP